MRKLNALKHGLTGHKLYRLHKDVINRCYNKNVKAYKYYGGRGITVCDEWRANVVSFYSWAINAGWQEGLEIDRINVNANYEPSNCRFVTRLINIRNTRANVYITHNNETKSLAEWAEIYKIHYKTLQQRIKRDGLSFDEAIIKPFRHWSPVMSKKII